MNTRASMVQLGILLIGDVLTLALVTVFGFAHHGTVAVAGAERFLATFIPLVVAWLLVAPFLGAFDLSRVVEWRQLWRPFWGMVLAAPMAAFLRGVWLNSAILPVFVFVLGGVSALALLVWRGLYDLVIYWKR